MNSQYQFSTNPVNNSVSNQLQSYQTPQWIQQPPTRLNAVCDTLNQTVSASTTNGYHYQNTCQNHPSNMTIQNQFQPQLSYLHRPSCKLMESIHCFSNSHPHRIQNNYMNTRANLRAVTKLKQNRSIYTTEQVAVQHQVQAKVYRSKPYMTREKWLALVQEHQMSNTFKVASYPSNAFIQNYLRHDDLSYVESQINNPDKFGFVTLDTRAMIALVNAIDNILSHENKMALLEEIQVCEVNVKLKEENKTCSPIYEPVSPASPESTSTEDSTCAPPPERKQALQGNDDILEFLLFHKNKVQ